MIEWETDSDMVQMCLFETETMTQKDEESEKIECVLLNGSGFVGGKNRIRDFGLNNPTVSEFATMLKSEYGIGGRSYMGLGIFHEQHDSGGIKFEWRTGDGEVVETNVTWAKAADVILKLIKQRKYI